MGSNFAALFLLCQFHWFSKEKYCNQDGDQSLQLYVTLRANEITLPMAYRHLQQAMIYHAVRAYDSEQSEHLHNTGYQTEDRRFKLFTFGPLQGSYSVNSGTITFRGEVRFEIRSADPALLQTLVIAWKPGTAVRL